MKDREVRKTPGCSSVFINEKVLDFFYGNELGTKYNNEVLELVVSWLKSEGYGPDPSQVLLDIEEDGKESLLSLHSEKMAVVLGLINGNKRVPIHIVTNLRVCGDCHLYVKLFFTVYDHRIVVRDQNSFHHF
ncbi:LOW QUALITY PROTEIN: DYW domain [Dillenia turbinata]|uniref:DYW domain n=1 Tax=Dillenia turbinata TaxID=194707 RepID=A0AAN8ZAP0_9MAGN